MGRPLDVTVRNARFQEWAALVTNRTKRSQGKRFLVQGVRPITIAVERGWPLTALLRRAGDERPSAWCERVVERFDGPETYLVAPDLLAELGERADEPPELVAVAELPDDDLDRIDPTNGPVVCFDRPVAPGNIGSLIRSVDAFGAAGLIVCGHGADPYDPKSVRASTGSVFAVPVVRAGSPRSVLSWAREHGLPVIGTDETGEVDIADTDLTGPHLLVVGNETTGMSRFWRESADLLARIPIGSVSSTGEPIDLAAASSLNVAAAGAVVLYEAARQRSRER